MKALINSPMFLWAAAPSGTNHCLSLSLRNILQYKTGLFAWILGFCWQSWNIGFRHCAPMKALLLIAFSFPWRDGLILKSAPKPGKITSGIVSTEIANFRDRFPRSFIWLRDWFEADFIPPGLFPPLVAFLRRKRWFEIYQFSKKNKFFWRRLLFWRR